MYVNDETGVPDWITVNTGMFGMKENFVPLAGTALGGDDLVLPFEKDVVTDAPAVSDAAHLDEDESAELYAYYQQYRTGYADASGQDLDSYPTGGGFRTDTDTASGPSHVDSESGYDTSGPTTDQAITRSEEKLRVGTERVETGRARLRKYVVTEQQTVTVPVSHEEVRLEREPITESNRDAAYSGPEISEEEHEVVLHAEGPVVDTEVVAVERVRLGTETVTGQEAVSAEVRKEEVELDDSPLTGRPTEKY